MREAEQLIPLSMPGGAAKATTSAAGRSPRWVRVWAAAVLALMVINLVLVFWYAISSGDYSTILSHQLLTPFLSISYAGLGVAITARQRRNPIGWMFLAVSTCYVLTSLTAGLTLYAPLLPSSDALLDMAHWLNNWVWLPAQLLPLTFGFLLFPDGHLPSPRWRPVGWAAGLGIGALMLGLAAHPGPVSTWGTLSNPYGIAGTESLLNVVITAGGLLLLVGALGCMLALIVRFRRSRGVERAQMKWLVYAVVVVLVLGVLVTPLWLTGGLVDPLAMELSIALTSLMTLGIGAAATVAVLRYRLYDIDVIINRTLVYSVMTAVIMLVYSLALGAAGVLLGVQANRWLALLATGLVAVLFQPLRDRLQRGVNRLLYGQRDEPLEVLTQLGRQLEQSMTPDAVYPTLVATVARALRLPYVALEVRADEGFRTVEKYGPPVDDPLRLPLSHQGEVVGRLLVGRRTPDEVFSGADERLLQTIAHQAGTAVHNLKLTADLQRSRQQIVAGREEERRRLRRDLHDGLGPSLASLLLEARVLRRLIRDDPAAAERLADEFQGDIRSTIEDIRRVVYALRPPALDDLGLVPAIQVMGAKIGHEEVTGAIGTELRVQVDAPHDLPALPAAVEVAAYRIVQEALANVLHHAQAHCAIVSLRLDDALHIEIADDGVGFRQGRPDGLGLRSMRARAAELGGTFSIERRATGGTVVGAALPIEGGLN